MYGKRGILAQYRQTHSAAADDDPHRLIALLLAGVIEQVRGAGACIAQGDVPGKLAAIRRALDILDGLRLSLDHQAGGEIARGLDSLYEYASLRLVEANLRDDTARLQEVESLLAEIESAWLAIPQQLQTAGGSHG